MAVAANLLMVVLELLGLYQVRSKLSWKLVVFYTQLSNLIAFGTSLLFLFLPAGQLALLRYLSTCMLMMTFCVTAFVLIPWAAVPGSFCFPATGCIIICCARCSHLCRMCSLRNMSLHFGQPCCLPASPWSMD